jgi:hypothetical protein
MIILGIVLFLLGYFLVVPILETLGIILAVIGVILWILGAENDGQPGTEFEVTITYTPRAVAGGKEEPVDVDKVIKGLDVPRSFDGIGGHDGDPDFHSRTPKEL